MRRRTRIFLLLMALSLIGVLLLRSQLGEVRVKTGSMLLLELRGDYLEAPPQTILGQITGGSGNTLVNLMNVLRMAKVDDRISGVIARIGPLNIGWAKAQEMRELLADFKQSKKPLLALLESEFNGANLEYYVSLVADRVYLTPAASAPVNGLAATFTFLGGVWDKIDVEMNVEQIREYKTMGDMIENTKMTDAHREMANSLLDSLDEQFVTAVADARRLEPEGVREIIDDAPTTPRAFESAGLSDGTKYLQTLHDEQGGKQTPLVREGDYAQVDPRTLGLGEGPKIAVVFGVGAIHTGESRGGLRGQTLGSDTISKALQDAADDDEIKAILFRVDSEGGSALASDLIWRATRYARAKKPLVVSMSDVAGSGGYYISAGADRIIAQPATMTGSIGVVVARPTINKMLGNLGITTETLSRGKFAYLDDLTVPLGPEGRDKILAGMDHVYAQFIDRVAAGRSMSVEAVDAIGGGRVWTGEQAKERGLVDELGGFPRAIATVKRLAEIEPDQEVELVYFPKPKGLLEQVAELLGAPREIAMPAEIEKLATMMSTGFREGTYLATMRQAIEVR